MIKKISTYLFFLLFVSSVGAKNQDLPIIDYSSITHPEIGTGGMVVSQRKVASEVGAKILREGGNAVDAAVATALALAVVLPRAGNLGGGGFMLIYSEELKKTVAIDYREMAPLQASRDMFLDSNGNYDRKKAQFSLLSAGVPGTVAGLHYALKKYGTLSWEVVIDPAITLAEDGFVVPHDLSSVLSNYRNRLTANAATARTYYKRNKVPYEAGEIIKLPDLAWSLKELKKQGPAAFYKGKIAEKIVAEMERNGGLITSEDLANYKVKERVPVKGIYKGYEIVSMPPSSSGGVHLIQMLNMLEPFSLKEMGFGSAQSIHLMSEVMKRAYADRSRYLGDTDFVSVPLIGLTNKEYAKALLKEISLTEVTSSEDISNGNPLPYESPDTTHFSVMDAKGNVVSNTYTLNFSYGSGIVIPDTGILMNNEMDDFSSKKGVPNAYGLVGFEANEIKAQKRPLSSMTPTIVFKNQKPYLVLGSPGGSRIITTVLQVVINVLEHDMNIKQAVISPRIHHQWLPDVLLMEEGFSSDTIDLLKEKGHTIRPSRTMGSVQAIISKDNYLYGAADPRRPEAGAVVVSP
ncbi:MAG TPA: gamma-glutamyltransferase [Gammaproteobacteria bacterium]|jgi:gamma-glutamyltranspeptidase/glutathione hydrolase|nr:gamma-glutamyltransferase [Gammaproteobacteria bacterium]HIO04422.1 gamma-glutamyltransferase [Gammaproteobacteria bacterium]